MRRTGGFTLIKLLVVIAILMAILMPGLSKARDQARTIGCRANLKDYCAADPGRRYAVYFPDGGTVNLGVSAAKDKLQVRWLDINRSTWQQPQTVTGGATLELKTPGKGHWAVLVLAL